MCGGEVTRFCPENRRIPRENRGKRLLCRVDARHLFERRKQSSSLLCRSAEGQEGAAHARKPRLENGHEIEKSVSSTAGLPDGGRISPARAPADRTMPSAGLEGSVIEVLSVTVIAIPAIAAG
jgi:hypothetical protein